MPTMFTQNDSQLNEFSIRQLYYDHHLEQQQQQQQQEQQQNLSTTSTGNDLEASFLESLIWSLLFYPMVILAAIGNLLIIWIISTNPLMRNIMNRYLINLTLSDFLSVTFNASFNFVFMLNQHWPFGKIYCIANNFIANLTIVSSVSTMMLISIDRYYAIVHPLRPRKTKRRFILSIGTIWSLSIIFSLPPLIYSDTEDIISTNDASTFLPTDRSSINSSGLMSELFVNTTNDNNITLYYFADRLNSSTPTASGSLYISTRTLCIMRWPDGVSGFSTYEFWYNWAFLILFYVIPVSTMVVALVLMSRVLWPGEHIGEHTTLSQHTLIRSKRKVVCMLICVISIFALCWLPYHCYFISIYWWPSLIKISGIKHVYLAFYWFAMANSLFNPVILFAMNRRIRNYTQHYLKRFKCTCCWLLTVKKRNTLYNNMNQRISIKMINHHHSNYHGNFKLRQQRQRQQQNIQSKVNCHQSLNGPISKNKNKNSNKYNENHDIDNNNNNNNRNQILRNINVKGDLCLNANHSDQSNSNDSRKTKLKSDISKCLWHRKTNISGCNHSCPAIFDDQARNQQWTNISNTQRLSFDGYPSGTPISL